MRDLILGAISANYTIDDVRNWVHSIKMSGFDGQVAMFCYNFTEDNTEIIDFLKKNNVDVFAPTFNNMGQPVNFFEHHSGRGTPTNNNELVHQVRFFHFWTYLNELKRTISEYRFVIVTDVRDVVFQENPSDWLTVHDDNIDGSTIVGPSENIRYADEQWNLGMITKHYGPHVVEYLLKDKPVCNVGTIAARFNTFMDLCINIYQSSLSIHPNQLPMPGNQTGFNFLINTVYKNSSDLSNPSELWACQCGTMADPTKTHLFEHWIEDLDIGITDEGIVTNFGKPFVILHQYDRVEKFLDKVNERYREIDEAHSRIEETYRDITPFENKPEYVDIALQYGYDAEVDVWWRDGEFWLGHDSPRYRIGPHFLQVKGMWCHAKNADAFEAMLKDDRIHCFWHDMDHHTLTSEGISWTHPNAQQYLTEGVVVILKKPETIPDVFGICSDEVKFIKEELTGKEQKSFSMKDARSIEDIIPF